MNLLACRDFEYTSRGFFGFVYVCEQTMWLQPTDLLILFKMPKVKPKKKASCKNDQPSKSTRQQYPLDIKYKAIAWRTKDNMSNKQISTKIKAEYKLDIPPSTLSTWWNAENMNKFSNVAPDRINVQDVWYNLRQRPGP